MWIIQQVTLGCVIGETRAERQPVVTLCVSCVRSTQAARDLWWTKLNEVVAAEGEHEPKSTNIQVVFYDVDTNIEYVSTQTQCHTVSHPAA